MGTDELGVGKGWEQAGHLLPTKQRWLGICWERNREDKLQAQTWLEGWKRLSTA